MQTLKINIPDGFEIHSLDKFTGEVKFKEKGLKEVTERITTVDDVLSDNGWTHERFDEWTVNMTEDEKAYVILKFLAISLNEGWTPNWDNASEYKYYPWFWMVGGPSGFRFLVYANWNSDSNVGSRLCFKSQKLAEHAGKQFVDVYRKFMVL